MKFAKHLYGRGLRRKPRPDDGPRFNPFQELKMRHAQPKKKPPAKERRSSQDAGGQSSSKMALIVDP